MEGRLWEGTLTPACVDIIRHGLHAMMGLSRGPAPSLRTWGGTLVWSSRARMHVAVLGKLLVLTTSFHPFCPPTAVF